MILDRRKVRLLPFLSVYDGAAARMMGAVVSSWSPEQRQYREGNIRRKQGFKPIYRINVRLK